MKSYILIFLILISANIFSQTWNFNVGDSLYDYYGYLNIPTVRCFYKNNNLLYVGGSFTKAGSLNCDNLLIWDGINWTTVQSGGVGGSTGIYCIENYNNQFYRCGGDHNIGSVSGLDYISRHNGTNWTWLINGIVPSSPVSCMKTYNNKLYIGGSFSSIGTSTIWSVASWDGNSFDKIFERSFWGYLIRTMEVFNNELFFGGHTLGIVQFGGDTIDYAGIYKYDGTDCYDVGQANMMTIWDMEVDTFNNFLYVCGDFVSNAPSCPNNLYRIAKWDGYNWYNLLGGMNDGVGYLKMYRGELYAGGGFVLAGGKVCIGMARWNGEEWNPLDTSIIGGGGVMEVFNDELYVSGTFISDTDTTYGLGRWYMPPDTTCNYLQPLVHSFENGELQDTFYLINDTVQVQFYNNNAYVDTWNWDFGDTGTSNVKDPNHIYTDTGIYNVELIVTHNSCVDTASTNVTILLGTGISVNETNLEEDFKLYPNPTSGTLFIEFQSSFTPSLKGESFEIQIVDTKGKVLVTQKVRNQKAEVNISSLSKGVYFVKIGEYSEKFVKE